MKNWMLYVGAAVGLYLLWGWWSKKNTSGNPAKLETSSGERTNVISIRPIGVPQMSMGQINAYEQGLARDAVSSAIDIIDVNPAKEPRLGK